METQQSKIPAASNGKAHFVPEYLIPSIVKEDGDENAPQLLTTLRRRAVLVVGVIFATTALIMAATSNQKSLYKSTFQLLVEPVAVEKFEQLAQTNGGDGNGSQITQTISLDYATQIQVLLSPKLMNPVIQKIQTEYPDVSYDSLIASLKINRPDDTKLLVVSYEDTDAKKVKFILDQVAQGYMRYSQQERQANLRQGVEFVNNQILKNQRRVDSLQREIQNFRQQNNFVDPEKQVDQIAKQSGALEEQRVTNEREIAEARKSYSNLQGRSGAIAALAADPAYQSFLVQLRDLDSKIAVESARFQSDTLELDALRAQRDNLLPILRREARRVLGNKLADADTQLSVLETRQQSISNAARLVDRQGQRLPVVARLYTDLTRELEVAQGSLSRFLQTRENLQVGAARKEVPWQLIAPPELPQTPSDPRPRNLMFGALAGLFLGITAAGLADKLDGTICSTTDLKKRSNLPLLGTIPHDVTLQKNTITRMIPHLLQIDRLRRAIGQSSESRAYTDRAFSDAFRSLYTSIRLLSSDTPITSLVISSALPGEGKSTVSMHLAQAAAAMGQRVLLVDADLRNPEISKLLNLPNEVGLSDLIETDLHPEQVIRSVNHANASVVTSQTRANAAASGELFVVASGLGHLDPTRLLSSQRMKQLVDYFQTVFDLVIYDTPPSLALADSSLLAAHTDGMILVAAVGKSDQISLAETLEGLKTTRIPVWGVVANEGAVKD